MVILIGFWGLFFVILEVSWLFGYFMYFGQFIGILVILKACILIKKKKKSLGGILVVLEV